MIENLFNTQDASRMLGVTPHTLRTWANESKLSYFCTEGGHRRFFKDDIENFKKRPPRHKDLIGRKFGRLLVKEKVEKPDHVGYKTRCKFWKCICDCGKETIVSSSCLLRVNKPTQSCGCLNYENFACPKPKGEAAWHRNFLVYKRTAKRRSLEFKISEDKFRWLCSQPCYFCGSDPNRIIKANGCNGGIICNGIDRTDNNNGYLDNNCVPCCKNCNFAKTNLDVKDFRELIIKIYTFWASKD